MECNVCYLNDLTPNRMIKCTVCDFECCKECLKKFILEGIGLAKCMNCNKIFTKNFLCNLGGKLWLSRATEKSYKMFLKKMYFEREKSKIPETLSMMKQMQEEEKIKKERSEKIKSMDDELKKLKSSIGELEKKSSICEISRIIKCIYKFIIKNKNLKYIRTINTYYSAFINEVIKNDIEDINFIMCPHSRVHVRYNNYDPKKILELYNSEKILTYREKLNSLKHENSDWELLLLLATEYGEKNVEYMDYVDLSYTSKKKDAVPCISYIQPCPFDECRGLIESSNYECSICLKKICKKCRVPLEKKHKCKKEDIETVKLLKSDTKPCPKCATNIYRISGCYQVWCVVCHIAFDWNTGKIDNGTIHNPHYIEFIRNRGLTIHDNLECGELPPLFFLYDRMKTPYLHEKNSFECSLHIRDKHILIDYHTLSMTSNLVSHVLPREIRHNQETIDNDNKFFDCRVSYLNGKISEDEWKTKIYKLYENIEKCTTYVEVYNSLLMVLSESIKKLYTDLDVPTNEFTDIILYDNYIDEKNKILGIFYNYIEEARIYFNNAIIEEYSSNTQIKDFMIIGPKWDIMSNMECSKGLLRPKHFGDDVVLSSYDVFSSFSPDQFRIKTIDPNKDDVEDYTQSDNDVYEFEE